jgi:hypothetical protein
MATERSIPHCTKATQERIFRIAQRDGLTLKAISLDSGIPYSTLRGYAGNNGETAEMPVSALYKLVGVIPDQLLSLLLPEAHAIVRVPDGIDHDAIADWVAHYSAKNLAAHRKDSECEERIGPTEQAELDGIVVQFPGKAA